MAKKIKQELIRLVTAGSVDDGKSTLIGRLLFECGAIPTDQLEAVKKTSEKRGLSEIDFSLLMDGLVAEREQNITIDVAYRYFSLNGRRFIVADVPGHEQYTRNMASGAAGSDVAILLIDARKGLTRQSRRHLFLISLFKVSHVLIAVNKIDTVGYRQGIFEEIKTEIINFAARLSINDLRFIPISALQGDMVVRRRANLSWYDGPTLRSYLKEIEIISDKNFLDFRFPVQLVISAGGNFRGYGGQIASGIIRVGEPVMVLPSGQKSIVKKIFLGARSHREVFVPHSVILTLTDEIDVSRGDMIIREKNLPEISDNLEATVCWFAEAPLKVGGSYLLKQTTRLVRFSVSAIRYKINFDNLHRQKANSLKVNDVGRVYLKTSELLFFDPYLENRATGSFIIIDEKSANTIGAGVIVDRRRNEPAILGKKIFLQKGAVLWFTGLSGSGKSAIAGKLFKKLTAQGVDCERLDGDNLRQSLCRDLGFSKEDRDKNIERAAFIAGILSRHKVLVLASFISPTRQQRKLARQKAKNFIEIFVNAPLVVCEQRDPKGLYKKARVGQIKLFTGLDDKYEPPKKPDLELKTDQLSVQESVDLVLDYLLDREILGQS